jgi:predicted nuclease of restriction endonuclease-like (RecB) superfamily
MPGLRGFSPRNLRNMRMFYEQWKILDTNLADASAKLEKVDSVLVPSIFSEIPLHAFFSIGFSHHVMILSKTKNIEERRFYIQLCADLQLSHEALERRIAEDAYHNQGKMTNNFVKTIPDHKQAFRAIQMFKDSYLLDFINTEQLGQRDEDIDERVIENEIVHNMRNFIMTFGKGFAYIGCQVHYDKLGHDHWVDVLFFNRILKSLVVVELKKGAFKPAYLGQLSHYLHVLDDDERFEGENPPVGIILCKDADKTFVEYVLQDYLHPMGVATYQAGQKRLMELLPDEEEMKKMMSK